MVYKDNKMAIFPKFRAPITPIFKNKLIDIKSLHKYNYLEQAGGP